MEVEADVIELIRRVLSDILDTEDSLLNMIEQLSVRIGKLEKEQENATLRKFTS